MRSSTSWPPASTRASGSATRWRRTWCGSRSRDTRRGRSSAHRPTSRSGATARRRRTSSAIGRSASASSPPASCTAGSSSGGERRSRSTSPAASASLDDIGSWSRSRREGAGLAYVPDEADRGRPRGRAAGARARAVRHEGPRAIPLFPGAHAGAAKPAPDRDGEPARRLVQLTDSVDSGFKRRSGGNRRGCSFVLFAAPSSCRVVVVSVTIPRWTSPGRWRERCGRGGGSNNDADGPITDGPKAARDLSKPSASRPRSRRSARTRTIAILAHRDGEPSSSRVLGQVRMKGAVPAAGIVRYVKGAAERERGAPTTLALNEELATVRAAMARTR